MGTTKTYDLAVTIINYATPDLTIACVKSILPQMDGHNVCVVIVDNASPDGSAETLAAFVDTLAPNLDVRLLRSPKNGGFSAGHNLAIQSVEATHYFLLNSDAELRAGCLSAALQAVGSTEDKVIVAARLEGADGRVQTSCFRAPHPVSELIRAASTRQVTRLLARFDQPLPAPAQEEIGWASFAAIVLPQALIAQVGLMDEGYFLYFEDTDYCMMARAEGWQISYAQDVRVVHHRGGSAPVKTLAKARKRLPRYYYESRSRLFRKHYGRFGLLRANLYWHLGRCIAWCRLLALKPVPKTNAREMMDVWAGFWGGFETNPARLEEARQ